MTAGGRENLDARSGGAAAPGERRHRRARTDDRTETRMNRMVAQMPQSWHHSGLYLGMHWGWWIFWIAAALILVWAFWRLYAERRQLTQDVLRREAAEETLRERFARGEIDEEELARRLRVLQQSRGGASA